MFCLPVTGIRNHTFKEKIVAKGILFKILPTVNANKYIKIYTLPDLEYQWGKKCCYGKYANTQDYTFFLFNKKITKANSMKMLELWVYLFLLGSAINKNLVEEQNVLKSGTES